MRLNFFKYFFIFNFIIAISYVANANIDNKEKIENKLLSFPNQHQLKKWQQFDQEISFKFVGSDSYSAWGLDHYYIKCNNLTYFCTLNYYNKNINFTIPNGDNITGLNAYLYKSSSTKLYKIILLEAEEERGVGWYYILVLKENNLLGKFLINQGRNAIFLFDEGKKFIFDNTISNDVSLPKINHSISSDDIDEIYVSPKYFLSIFNKKDDFLFMFNKIYTSATEEIDHSTYITDEYIYIEKKIN
jgi:hypothetical protein